MTTVPTASSPTHSSRWLIVLWLLTTQVLSLFSLVIWYVIASYALSDLEEGVTVSGVFLTGLIWLYPLFPLGCIVFSWKAFRRKKGLLAAILTVLPLLVMPLVVLILFPPSENVAPVYVIQTPVQLVTPTLNLTGSDALQIEINEGQRQGNLIIAALENYYQSTGSYPARLEDLVPGHINEIPVSATGQPYWYQPMNDIFVIRFYLTTKMGDMCAYTRQVRAWECGPSGGP